MRRVRLAALRIDQSRRFSWDDRQWTLETMDVNIRFPEWTTQTVTDPAFLDAESGIRRILDRSIANPDGLFLYAQAGKSGKAKAPSWQPLPENSPGLPWIKIPLEEEGLYVIDGRWLSNAGIDPAGLRPAELAIYSRGERIAGIPLGATDATFATGARLVFPAVGSDSPETATRYYYVGRALEPARNSLSEAPVWNDTAAPALQTYNRTWRIEQDNSLQTRVGNFLSIRQMEWVWKQVTAELPATLNFDCPGLVNPTPSMKGRLFFYVGGPGSIAPVEYSIELNGSTLVEGQRLTRNADPVEFEIPANLARLTGNRLTFKLTQSGRPIQFLWVDALEFTGPSLLRAKDGQHLAILADSGLSAGQYVFEGVGFRPYRVIALDVSNPESPERLPISVENDVVRVQAQATTATRLRIIEADMIRRAPAGLESTWRDWRSVRQSADLIVLHHSLFTTQAQLVADMHAENGTEVLTVPVDSLYEAYSNGETSSDAIRDFLRDSVNYWEGRRPSYALLVGDCTSDGRGVARNGIINYVPTRTLLKKRGSATDEFAGDAWYTWLNGDDEIADIIIGRLSVANRQDADTVTRKLLDYAEQNASLWAQRVFAVTDSREFATIGTSLMHESVNRHAKARLVSTVHYPWEDNFYLPSEYLVGEEAKVSPVVTGLIEEEINEGAGLVLWMGHGSPNLWSNQRLWFGGDTPNSDNLRLRNANRLPFVASFTCNNGAIDYPVPRWNISIIEDMMRVSEGGIIGGFIPSGPGFPNSHAYIADPLLRVATSDARESFGVMSELARLSFQAHKGPDEHSRMYLLLGDPMLSFPPLALEPALSVSPALIETRQSEITVEVELSDITPRGTMRCALVDPFGHVVAEREITDRRTSLHGSFSPADDFLDLVVDGKTEDGSPLFARHRMPRQNAALSITTAEEERNEDGTRALAVVIGNENEEPARAVLELTLSDEEATELEHTMEIAPRGTEAVSFPLPDVSSPTRWTLRLAAENKLPTNHGMLRQGLLVPSGTTEGVDLFVEANATQWHAMHDEARQGIAVPVGNSGSLPASATLEWKLTADGSVMESGTANISAVQPGGVIWATVRPQTGLQKSRDLHLRIVTRTSGEDVNDANDSARVAIDHGDFPDLEIVSDSITVSPNHLAEGATVFIEGLVRNQGGNQSWPVEISMHSTENDQPLKSFAGQPQSNIPALSPGETWPFRVRWDPFNNLQTETVRLSLDHRKTALDLNRSNGILDVSVDIRSKWKLVPLGTRIEPGSQSHVRLIAGIENAGETDARRVVITFYGDTEQIEENLLGEELVELIPAGERIEVPFEWDVRNQDLQQKRAPSFSIAIKGSLQRTSSVTE